MSQFPCVIDTNVLFDGLTQKGGAAGLLIDAWLGRTLEVCISNALAYEYAEVLSRQLSPHRWQQLRPVLEILLDRTRFVTIYYSWRPISPDPGDDHVIDCAMNAGAAVITSNLRDFQSASIALGLRVLTPVEAILHLLEGEDEI